MATRDGARLTAWLQSCGWKLADEPVDDLFYGDPLLLDPVTGEALGPHEAAERETIRSLEES